MFKKLVSNLPFNPSLISQVAFYAKRMHAESTMRRTAFIFIVLTMFLQMFAVISPAQPTLADSDNDIVRGGFTSREQGAAICRDGSKDFGKILDYYGISCDALASANPKVQRLNSIDLNRELDSLGRNPVPANHPKTGKASDSYPVSISGVGQTLYMKNLWYWDSGASSTYNAIEVANKQGIQMWILMDCGNIVTRGQYTPPKPPVVVTPKPPVELPQTLSCSNLFMNVANGSRVKLGDQIVVKGQASGKNIKAGQKVDLEYAFLDATTSGVMKTEKTAGVGFTNSIADDPASHSFSANNPGEYVIKLTVRYDGTKVATGSASGSCVKNISVQKACPTAKNSQDLENCLDEHKVAYNNTQGAKKADTVVAKAGDEIQYNLSVTNTGNITVPKSEYQMQENLSDVLDYATIVDLDGGTKGANNVVTWPRVDIKAKETIQKTIKLKMKSPIPGTPVSSSDAGRFDCIMMNVFGVDSVSIKVDCPILKTVETTTTLPSTGPGTSVAIGFVIMSIMGYFFARARLYATELDVIRSEYAQGGY